MAEGFGLAANQGFELQTWAVFWQQPSCAFRKSRVWILCVNNSTVIPAPSCSFLFQLHPHGQNCCKEQEISQWVTEVSLVWHSSLTCSSGRSWRCCGHCAAKMWSMLLKEAEISAQHWSMALFLRFGSQGDTGGTSFSIRDLIFWGKNVKEHREDTEGPINLIFL